jgi:hypothetical protein
MGVIMKEKKGVASMMLCIAILILFASASVYSATNNLRPLTVKELYELKERCGKTCAQRFKEEYGKEGIYSDKDSKGLRSYNSHYNAKLDKCFILIEDTSYPPVVSRQKLLLDIIENKIYGEFYAFSVDKKGLYDITQCQVQRKPCKSEQEWDSLIKPFMEE